MGWSKGRPSARPSVGRHVVNVTCTVKPGLGRRSASNIGFSVPWRDGFTQCTTGSPRDQGSTQSIPCRDYPSNARRERRPSDELGQIVAIAPVRRKFRIDLRMTKYSSIAVSVQACLRMPLQPCTKTSEPQPCPMSHSIKNPRCDSEGPMLCHVGLFN
jgi:hypothetical protein